MILLPLGVAAHLALSDWTAGLRELSQADPEAALANALFVFRMCGWSMLLLTVLFGALLLRYFHLGRIEGRLPPSGWWSFGAFRYATGSTARRMIKFGPTVVGLLLISTIALVVIVEAIARTFSAGGS